MTTFRKTLTATITALALVATVAASATPAAADWRGHHGGYRGGHSGGHGGAIAAGIIGALALGAFAAHAGSNDYAPSYATPVYDESCELQNQPTYDRWGRFRGYRQVTVCN
jgi:hypothetical protein